ncbi:MAG: hypothetical protein ACR2J3_11685 [Aridibacter sp.]
MNLEYQRKNIIGFGLFLLLNLALSGFPTIKVFGQTPQISDQYPIVAEILSQPESPLQLAILDINNTNKLYQEISYSIENISNKEIFAYVILSSDEKGISGSGASFPRSFSAKEITPSSYIEQRTNLKPNPKIIFSVDYVEFVDGTSWGKDSQNRSILISAFKIGRRKGFERVKKLFAENSIDDFIKILSKPIVDLELPDKFKEEREKLGFGFLVGYKSIFSRLKLSYEKQGVGAIFVQIDDLEKLIKN